MSWSAARSITRVTAAGFLALVFALIPLSFGPAQVAQALSAPPGQINILPSVVVGARTATGTVFEPLALLLAKYAKDPVFWRDVATTTANRTAAQSANVAAEAAKFAVPATKVAPLARVISGTTVPLAGLMFGMMAGNAASRMFGFSDNRVCMENNGVLEAVSFITNGVNCAAYDNMLTTAQKNLDALAVASSANSCLVGGSCYRIAGNGAVSATDYSPCIVRSGSGAQTSNFTVTLSNGQSSQVGGYNFYVCGAYADGALLQNAGVWANNITVTSLRAMGGTAATNGPVVAVSSAPGNPNRQFRCTVVTLQGNFTRMSDSFTESDPAFKPILCPVVPSGQTITSTKVEEMGGPQPLTVQSAPATPEYAAYRANYPGCDTGACALDLLVNGVTCFTSAVLCADWFSDPNKATTYTCKYGPHPAPLAECNVYAPSFKADAVDRGTAYGDPVTGAAPTTQPTSTPLDVGVFGGPVKDPTGARQCFPSGWAALNPVEWVFQPVRCAYEWAFIPRQSVVTANALRASGAWARTPVGQLPGIVAVFGAMTPTVSGCSGPLVQFGALGINYSGYPMSACNQPVAGIAATMRAIGAAITIWYAALAIIRYVSGTIAYQRLGGSGDDA